MSIRRVAIGLLIGFFHLAVVIAAAIHWRLSVHVVQAMLLILAMLYTGLASIKNEAQRKKSLQKYWDRDCMGAQWKRRFPNSSAEEIREFLDTFVDSFLFEKHERLCFSPDDKVMDVYRALNPSGFPDSMEVEDFSLNLRKRYSIDLASAPPDIMLGEIYAQISHV
jgi:hypothetical protein